MNIETPKPTPNTLRMDDGAVVTLFDGTPVTLGYSGNTVLAEGATLPVAARTLATRLRNESDRLTRHAAECEEFAAEQEERA